MKLIQKVRNNLSLPIGHALIGDRLGDRFLASYPRSGSTWLRTMLVNILVPGANSNPDVFNAVIPGVSITQILGIRRLSSPRLIHSHTFYRPVIKRVVYTVRDGRDVLISFYHYLVTRRGLSMSFEEWFRSYETGVYGHRWDTNVQSWMEEGKSTLGDNMLIIHFEKMKAEPIEVLKKVCSHLGIIVNDNVIETAIEQASIDNARKIERSRADTPNSAGNTSFYRGGNTGQWEDYFNMEIEQRFWKLSSYAMKLAGYSDVV